ncbi:MAG TPA: SHOCT domain-containing protein [Gemmatimonadaceae bacterium]
MPLAEVAKEFADEPRLVEALQQLQALLIPGEFVDACAVQRRIFALMRRRELVAATTGRLILIKRGMFGGFHPTSVRWQDLKDIHLDVGVFGARLVISAFASPDLAIAGQAGVFTVEGLRKSQAEAVYRLCQAQDQAWREKRRVRELEEMRAKSGGIQFGGPMAGEPAMATSGGGGGDQDDAVERLEKAKTMLARGLISDSEYEALKARIVNTL